MIQLRKLLEEQYATIRSLREQLEELKQNHGESCCVARFSLDSY